PVAVEVIPDSSGLDGLGEIPGQWPDRIDGKSIHDGGEHCERQRPPPYPSAHASALRVSWRPQPQRVANMRPRKRSLLAPDQDQDQEDHPDEPNVEADQEGIEERVPPSDPVAEPGSDPPAEDAHRDGRRQPYGEDLTQRILW